MSGERIIITLRLAPDPYRRTRAHRLRGALKMLLRTFALRCEHIEAIDADGPDSVAGAARGAKLTPQDCAWRVRSIEADP